MISFSGEVTEEVYVGGCNNLPSGEFEKVKSFAVEDDRIIDNDKHIMKIKSHLSESQRELRHNGGGNCESLNLAGSKISEEKIENSEVASQHEVSPNLKEAFTSKQITDRAQTGSLVVEVSSENLSDENCETNPGGLSIYSEHKSQGRNVLYSSNQSHSKHVCMDQCQVQRIAEAGLSAVPYQQDRSGFNRFDARNAQTEVESNKITVVGEDPADIICFSPVKIALAENCNHSADEEFNYDKVLANSTTCLEYSSSSGVRDKMVSTVPGSIGEFRKPIKESVLEAVDEAEIHDSDQYNEGNLSSSSELYSSSKGTQDVNGSGILCPKGDGNKLIKHRLTDGIDGYEIPDSSNKPNDGYRKIKVKHGMLSPESLKVEESQMCSHVDFAPSSLTQMALHKVLLERLHTLPQPGDTTQANEVGKTINALRNISQMEDTHLESYINDAQVPGKGPSAVVEEYESSKAFDNFQDAPLARRSVDESGLENPSFLNQESRPFHGSGNDADELDVIHCVEDQLSSPVAIDSLFLELDSSQGTSKNHIASVTTDCIDVEGDQTSSGIKRKAVDILNQDIVEKDSETGKHSGSESFPNELYLGLDDTEQCTNDNTNFPVKNKESCPKKGNHLILPRDVVPFSDDWLAAMEAAGEDILTMKGGAVQNSPQEKSLPEPSPWSPVKKKNNQPGPFDCTKFHHNVPPES